MTNKKKIALLNLPVDENFGGHLQRYALMVMTRRLGYDVTHFNLRFPFTKRSRTSYIKKGIKRLFKYPYYWITKSPQYKPLRFLKYYLKKEPITEAFYEKYIHHTPRIYSNSELLQYLDFDDYIVGSDQVWRKKYMQYFDSDLGVWFLDFVSDNKGKRIAYGASFGIDEQEYITDEQVHIRPLYNKFDAVSVRENSGLELLKEYGWTSPKAEVVLAPTLLLAANDYIDLYRKAKTKPLQSKLLCYILDTNDEKDGIIKQIAEETHLQPYIQTIEAQVNLSVEQWIRNFSEAEYVITDSYHGMLFSLIFHKPFKLIINQARGAARFDSVAEQLGFTINEPINWNVVDLHLDEARKKSIQFLRDALKNN